MEKVIYFINQVSSISNLIATVTGEGHHTSILKLNTAIVRSFTYIINGAEAESYTYKSTIKEVIGHLETMIKLAHENDVQKPEAVEIAVIILAELKVEVAK